MNDDELQFRGNNPGAVQFGNFINYYQFHPPENRLNLLPTEVWQMYEKKQFAALDLGCNSGNLTIALYEFLNKNKIENCRILGIDLDPVLIKRAKEKNVNRNIEFHCFDFMKTTKDNVMETYLIKNNLKQFDAVFCFSITMWIHLNNGDEGFLAFLKKITEISDMVIIEPQPWKCYRSAVKRLKKANHEFPFYKELKIKNIEEEIENVIQSHGKMKKIWESPGSTEWERKIQIFRTF